VFKLALQTEGLIRSILHLLGLDLAVPHHSTMSRRARSLELPRSRTVRRPMHLLVDSTGLRLCGPGEWLIERHGARTRRLWRKLHLATDADTGEIAAAELTEHDADDGGQVEASLDGYGGPIASLTADGAYDRDDVYAAGAARSRRAAVVIPLPSSAVLSTAGGTPPTQRDEHILGIAAHGRMGWQRRWGHTWRALVEADLSRWKRVIGGELRSRTNDRRSTEVAIAIRALRCLRWDDRSTCASRDQCQRWLACAAIADPCNTVVPQHSTRIQHSTPRARGVGFARPFRRSRYPWRRLRANGLPVAHSSRQVTPPQTDIWSSSGSRHCSLVGVWRG
jgi:hypothetical protein